MLSIPFLHAQIFVGGQLLEEQFDGSYIKVCPISRKYSVYDAKIDYGQKKTRKVSQRNKMYITQENGKIKEFNSEIDILNFMEANGFAVFHISDSTRCIIYIREKR